MGRGLSDLQKRILGATYDARDLGQQHLIFTDGCNARPKDSLAFRLFGHSGKTGEPLTGTERATLSRALSRLKSRGLVDHDRRCVSLTPAGVAAVEAMRNG